MPEIANEEGIVNKGNAYPRKVQMDRTERHEPNVRNHAAHGLVHPVHTSLATNKLPANIIYASMLPDIVLEKLTLIDMLCIVDAKP
jgi:hypothetical protein